MSYINGKWRQGLHLEPPHGWLNDPNGLCYFNGHYHVYFQYGPENANGNGQKCWGHYQSADLLDWEFTGTVFFPDIPEDKDGVYSGSAIVCGNALHIFYTGNVKEEGDHDYIYSGRGANVIHVVTTDGVTMGQKQVVLRNSDYPSFCSCHVRDPKVWKENDIWHMVLGARTRSDKGCVLHYISENLSDWIYKETLSASDFGYMWECPDMFTVDSHRFLSVSPQGLPHEETRYQNVYSSGYFQFDESLDNFSEWDFGFDFYAPQTFEAPDGRRILIGWMGIGDIPYKNPTEALGYQHCLTLPREISLDHDGRLCQKPFREFDNLRDEKEVYTSGQSWMQSLPFELTGEINGPFSISLDDVCELSWDGHVAELKFTNDTAGQGRDNRKAVLENCRDIRIIADHSSLEIFLDGGKCVFSTRMYPAEDIISVRIDGLDAAVYSLKSMKKNYIRE